MDLPAGAPVRAQARLHVAAAPSVVWTVLTSFERWPEWNGDVHSIDVAGPAAVGMQFTWRAGLSRIRSTLRVLDAPRLVAWSGKTAGIRALHVWRLTPERAGTLVWTGETFQGLPALLLKTRLQRTLQDTLDRTIDALRAECESQVAAKPV